MRPRAARGTGGNSCRPLASLNVLGALHPYRCERHDSCRASAAAPANSGSVAGYNYVEIRPTRPRAGRDSRTGREAAMRVPFANEPLTDFSQLPAHRAFEAALARVDAEDDREYPLVIGGEPAWTGEWTDSLDPCAPDRRVGRVPGRTPPPAARALD